MQSYYVAKGGARDCASQLFERETGLHCQIQRCLE